MSHHDRRAWAQTKFTFRMGSDRVHEIRADDALVCYATDLNAYFISRAPDMYERLTTMVGAKTHDQFAIALSASRKLLDELDAKYENAPCASSPAGT